MTDLVFSVPVVHGEQTTVGKLLCAWIPDVPVRPIIAQDDLHGPGLTLVFADIRTDPEWLAAISTREQQATVA